ncbi:MFS transporter [Pseudarthrobacter sp. SSS035]|uniref:MFS transporter n=1 Tax=Pseudarthrobacter sp. SSS035 TaxID=2931399 RepID=UPI00353093A4
MQMDRFDIASAELATLVVLQLAVYGAMQKPVGLLVGRFGPRCVLLTGKVVLADSQLCFAFAPNYDCALVARGCVGVGDALNFLCVLRLMTSWVKSADVPLAL